MGNFFLIWSWTLRNITSGSPYMTFGRDWRLFHGAIMHVNKHIYHILFSLFLFVFHSSFFQTDRNWVVFRKFAILGMRTKLQQCDVILQQSGSDTLSHITRCLKLLDFSFTVNVHTKKSKWGMLSVYSCYVKLNYTANWQCCSDLHDVFLTQISCSQRNLNNCGHLLDRQTRRRVNTQWYPRT